MVGKDRGWTGIIGATGSGERPCNAAKLGNAYLEGLGTRGSMRLWNGASALIGRETLSSFFSGASSSFFFTGSRMRPRPTSETVYVDQFLKTLRLRSHKHER
jgi:hypothetical protein